MKHSHARNILLVILCVCFVWRGGAFAATYEGIDSVMRLEIIADTDFDYDDILKLHSHLTTMHADTPLRTIRLQHVTTHQVGEHAYTWMLETRSGLLWSQPLYIVEVTGEVFFTIDVTSRWPRNFALTHVSTLTTLVVQFIKQYHLEKIEATFPFLRWRW